MKKIYLCLLVTLLVMSFKACNYSNSNINDYLRSGKTIDRYAKDVMPALENLPKYQKIKYKHIHDTMFIFQSDAVALIVKYDAKTYKSEKDKLEKETIFLKHKVKCDYEENTYAIPENEFAINSYKFRVVEGDGEDNTCFPHYFGMIGTSDIESSIAYLYYYDQDLDCISNSETQQTMREFVERSYKIKL